MERRRTLRTEEENEMNEVYCYELLYEGEQKAGSVVDLKTGITYADLKKYARVSVVQHAIANETTGNSTIWLGKLLIGRINATTNASALYVLLDMRNKNFIEPWYAYQNKSLVDPKYGASNINYPIGMSRSLRDIEKTTLKDSDEISFGNLVGAKLKVDTKFYIYGISKYV